MSNCFSLTSAEPFFNLLTARGEEEEEEEEREMEERTEESLWDKNVSISEFFVIIYLATVQGQGRSEEKWEAEAVDDEASFFFLFLFLSSQPGVVRSEGGPRWARDQGGLTSWQHTSSKPVEAVWILARDEGRTVIASLI